MPNRENSRHDMSSVRLSAFGSDDQLHHITNKRVAYRGCPAIFFIKDMLTIPEFSRIILTKRLCIRRNKSNLY